MKEVCVSDPKNQAFSGFVHFVYSLVLPLLCLD